MLGLVVQKTVVESRVSDDPLIKPAFSRASIAENEGDFRCGIHLRLHMRGPSVIRCCSRRPRHRYLRRKRDRLSMQKLCAPERGDVPQGQSKGKKGLKRMARGFVRYYVGTPIPPSDPPTPPASPSPAAPATARWAPCLRRSPRRGRGRGVEAS